MSVVNKVAGRVGLAPISALQAEHLQGRSGQDVFKPRSAREIQEIIRYANRHRTPVFTRSSPAANGDGQAYAAGGILIDLSGMDSIINVDTRNRAVRIEPGVTWGRLVDQLKKHQLKPSNPLLPRKDGSALASFLDRAPMLAPRFEYGEPLLTMEVVLPTGTIFRTGSASGPPIFKKTRADMVGPYGPGSMDMFRVLQGSRGTLGVVTWINVKAEYLPKIQKVFFLRCKDVEEIVKPLYRIPRLMIGNEMLALNDNDLAAILSGGKADLLPELKKALSPWTIVISLAGSPRLPERKLEYEEEALRAAVKELGMKLAEDPGVQGRDFVLLLRGPWEDGVYWKDALKGASLDIYFLTHLDKVPRCAAAFHALAGKYGYDPGQIGEYVQPLEHGRACHVEFSIPVDKGEPGGKEAGSFAREAVVEMTGQGGFFTRTHRPWAGQVYKQSPLYTGAMRKMKDILDPNHIMNLGELCN